MRNISQKNISGFAQNRAKLIAFHAQKFANFAQKIQPLRGNPSFLFVFKIMFFTRKTEKVLKTKNWNKNFLKG